MVIISMMLCVVRC